MQTTNTLDYLISQGFSKTILERFWKKINKTPTCWLWTGHTLPFGYGEIAMGTRNQNGHYQPYRAHKLSWIIHNGPIQDGFCVLHNCPGRDNPSCCNPDHLWLGTRHENNTDMSIKGTINAKLNAEQVLEIFTLGKTMRYRDVASKYNVCRDTVARIVRGEIWTRITHHLLR